MTEHILLESDVREVPELGRARKVHAALHCYRRLRRRSLELTIIDYFYLAVRTGRAGSSREYVLDLRFIDRSLGLTKHFPGRCIAVTLALAAATALCAWWIGSSTVPWWQHKGLPMCGALFALTVCACLVCAWRMTETLSLHSVHGRAALLEYTGGLGTLRMAHPFTRKLAAHIQLAIAARRSSEVEHLRDEMREHLRLKEAGVLSHEQYEASKARILAQHAPAARACRSALEQKAATAIRPADRGR
jgi:hypothetical protein